jgi:ATP-dependent 26S proteasome regulatory subunit
MNLINSIWNTSNWIYSQYTWINSNLNNFSAPLTNKVTESFGKTFKTAVQYMKREAPQQDVIDKAFKHWDDIKLQHDNSFQDIDIMSEFVLTEMKRRYTFYTEENLHAFLDKINQYHRILVQCKLNTTDSLEPNEWIHTLKTIWDNRASFLEKVKKIQPSQEESKLKGLIFEINRIYTDRNELFSTSIGFVQRYKCLAHNAIKIYINFLNITTHHSFAASELFSELKFDNSIALELINSASESLFTEASSYSRKIPLSVHFERENISGLPEGLENVVTTVAAAYDPNYQSIVEKVGLHPERGIILYGPPGTGKTVIAKAIGEYFGCVGDQIKITSGANLLDKWMGSTEKAVRDLFQGARDDPDHLHVIIIDEIDALIGSRTKNSFSVENPKVTQFLTELDGINSPKNIFVIGITNYIEALDPAAIRPGRLGTLVHVPLPNQPQRKAIFEVYLKKIDKNYLAEDYQVLAQALSKETEGFSGAEIKAISQNTSNNVFIKIIKACHFGGKELNHENREKVQLSDFLHTINLIKQQKRTEEKTASYILSGSKKTKS